MPNLFTIEWVGNINGVDKYNSITYPEASGTAAYKKGAPLSYDLSADGVDEVPLSTGVPSGAHMLGLALQDASGTTNADTDVLMPVSGDIFSAMVSNDVATLIAPVTDHRGVLMGVQQITTAATSAAAANGAGTALAATGTEFALDDAATDWVRVITVDPRSIVRAGGSVPVLPTLATGDRLTFNFLVAVLDADGQDS